ncbi:MAG TPA: ROK family transcriptional regulator [Blastocatellia bacterium]|nr:ROK family transcriptional regulator [Blastocatellia bacterium]
MKKINLHKAERATHQALRDLNEILVLNQVRERQPISRIDIADSTGLEGSTVSKIVTRLLENEFVYENGVGSASPQGGRKKRFLHLNPDKAYAVGVDLSPQHNLIAVSDFSGRILRQMTVENSSDPREALTAVAGAIRKLLQANQTPKVPKDRVAGIGVSLVGLVDAKEGRVLAGESLGWGEDVPAGSILRQALNLDLPIYFDNGARLAALAELWLGTHTARQPHDLVFLEISEGVGAGIVIQGQLYHGFLNGAGEFGHISLDAAGPRCSCGGRGCLEVFASDPATIARYRELCRNENRTAECRGEITIEEVIARAIAGNPRALEAVRQTAGFLGRGLIPIIYSVNPEAIVLGGAITKAWDIVYPEIRRVLAAQVTRFYSSHVTIIPSTLGEKPSLAGAIALVLARAFTVPSLGW